MGIKKSQLIERKSKPIHNSLFITVPPYLGVHQ
ncbi:hypothetical protein MBGDN05_00575 [Thermoplasmatales archaeon SCGC AB-539-N05]|nr:hypothetical protein MBGDN05_00575 [Thermoplasmatales archaeon SCGC AB-539-N05]